MLVSFVLMGNVKIEQKNIEGRLESLTKSVVGYSLPIRIMKKAWRIATVPGEEIMQYSDSEFMLNLEILFKSFSTVTGDVYMYNSVAIDEKNKKFKDWTLGGKISYISFEIFKWGLEGVSILWSYNHQEQFIHLYQILQRLISQ